jgi:Fanconi anemia group M protein
MKEYLEHPLIQRNKIEKRSYQVNIYEKVKDKDSLVVLPTGLGKSIIAILVLTHKLSLGKKALFLAPTKPLCDQHASTIRNITTLLQDDITVVTGEIYTPKKREDIYKKAKVIVATPQTIENDIEGRIILNEYGLVILDEAHRAVGNYAYVKIVRNYRSFPDSQVLGLTASPGEDFEKLKEIVENLGIKHIEVRKESDTDVKRYLANRFMRWEIIEIPTEIKSIISKIDEILKGILLELNKYSSEVRKLKPNRLSRKVLIEMQERIKRNLDKGGGSLYHALSVVSSAIKMSHLKDMLTSQGIKVAKVYLERLEKDKSKGTRMIRRHPLYQEIRGSIKKLDNIQPKLDLVKEILVEHLKEKKDARIMVFAEYRDTVEMLVPEIKSIEGARVVKFIGQTRKDREDGMTQAEQRETLKKFREGIYNILVSTSIGEEGIDIPATTLVVFYEPVPSAIRHIQRKGRTARDGLPGAVKILITKGSRDEAYYWSSIRKERKMYDNVYKLKEILEVDRQSLERQTKIEDFLF